MSVVDDVGPAADWIAEALRSSGYRADFSASSSSEIDRFFDDQLATPGAPKPGGLLSEQLGSRLFALGAYVGELVRRNAAGWDWVDADGDPDDEINVRLQRGPDDMIWPIQRVMKRYAEGAESGIAGYVAAVADVDVGSPPISSSKRRWRRRRQ